MANFTYNRLLAAFILKRFCERYPELAAEIVQSPYNSQWIAFESLTHARNLFPPERQHLADVEIDVGYFEPAQPPEPIPAHFEGDWQPAFSR